jgi:hypothetical protein
MICLPLVPSRRIRGPKIRPTRRRSGTGRPVALEPLESRALLAVTATLVGGDLVIAYNQAGDLIADITSDGTKYTVTGSGLVSQQFNVADVTGVITVRDDAAIFGQQFSVNDGIALANALQVNASVESTRIIAGITTATAGDVLIGSSAISLGKEISTAATNAAIVLSGATTLSGSVSLSTGSGGGNITFGGTLDGNGAQPLGLTAGTGSVTFTGLVGDTTPLGAITINSAANVTANGIRADSLTQVAGSGTTTLNGGGFTSAPAGTEAVRTSLAAGIWLTGTNLAANGAMTTTNSGTVTFNQSGTIAVAAAGDILADGAVSLTATGGITTAGDVTTTDDNVTFASKTTLSGPVAVNTGAGAGDIKFQSTLDGAQTLGLTAGTGSVTFTGLVGDTTPLGAITINSAANVTANGIRAASLTQVAGSGTTTLNGGGFTSAPAGTEAVRTSGAAGISLTGTNLAANGAMTTTNSGTVTFNQSGTIAVAAAGDILADGAVSLTATGGITTAGDVTTTDDNVTFASKTTLSGPVAVNTGAGAGDIKFQSTLDGAQTLELAAGSGAISFANKVGNGTPLRGLKLLSATSTTFASTLSLDGAGGAVSNGLSISPGVNDVTLNTPGSKIRNFTSDGIVFGGDSKNSTISGVSITTNGGSGISVNGGDYAGTVIEGNTIETNGRHGIFLAGEGSTSIGRIVITTPGLSGSPLTGSSAAQLQKPLNPQSSSIQAIANAGYPTVMPSLQSLGASFSSTPPTTLVPSGEIAPGISGIANPGAAYQAAAQTAFETNPALPTNGFDGLAVYDAATSGVVPASPPGAEPQDSYLFYDFIVAAGGVGGLSITGNTLADNVAAGLRADEGDHSGTTVQGNTIEGNRFGIVLVGARNLAIGGADAGQGNTIVGGGNAGGGQYRDGIYATGSLNGTTVVGTTITNAACGLVLDSAQSLTIDQVAVSNTQSHALWAKGALAGTVLDGLVVSRTTAVTTGVSAVLMNAEGLTVQNADVSGDGWGAYVFGTSTGTAITGSKLVGMGVGLNAYTATGLTLEATTANGGSYGLVTTGSLTGTRFLTSTFTAAGGGVAAGLYRTTGAAFQGNSFGATGTTFGVYATGTSTGTTFISNTLARNVVGLHLAAATALEFGRVGTGNTISGSTFAGLEAGGACTGSVVLATSWSTNVVNVINKATGLTVNPA